MVCKVKVDQDTDESRIIIDVLDGAYSAFEKKITAVDANFSLGGTTLNPYGDNGFILSGGETVTVTLRHSESSAQATEEEEASFPSYQVGPEIVRLTPKKSAFNRPDVRTAIASEVITEMSSLGIALSNMGIPQALASSIKLGKYPHAPSAETVEKLLKAQSQSDSIQRKRKRQSTPWNAKVNYLLFEHMTQDCAMEQFKLGTESFNLINEGRSRCGLQPTEWKPIAKRLKNMRMEFRTDTGYFDKHRIKGQESKGPQQKEAYLQRQAGEAAAAAAAAPEVAV